MYRSFLSCSVLSSGLRSVLISAAAMSCAASVAHSQQVPSAVAGPYNAVFLVDGEGLVYPNQAQTAGRAPSSPISDEMAGASGQWTVSFWFRSAEPVPATGTLLLAGIGEPSSAEARFIGIRDQHLSLWLGNDRWVSGQSKIEGTRWHFAAAAGDGHQVNLFEDGHPLATSSFAQGDVAPRLAIAPAVPAGPLSRHFGGKVASLYVYGEALSPEQIASIASNRPDFDLPQYAEASSHWEVQTRGMAGQLEPQDPSTLPRGKGGFQKPTAKPVSKVDLHSQLIGQNPWIIRGGWMLAAAPDVSAPGDAISRTGFDTTRWMVATVPGTVLTTMIDRGVYPDPDYGLNNLAIPETLAHQDYWYRVKFDSPQVRAGQHVTLTFLGVNYAAEVWLNGKELGRFKGAFIRGKFDVTKQFAPAGQNVLAVRVSPPPHPGVAQEESIAAGPGENGGVQVLDGPTFSATEGWDWIPSIRDRNTGIWQDVTLSASGPIEVGDLNVITTLPKPDRSEADVEIEAPLTNLGQAAIQGDVIASFDGINVTKHVSLPPGEGVVRLKPAEFPQLRVQNPRLWWPNGYGDPALHDLTVRFNIAGSTSSEQHIKFGMREVSYELSLLDASGHLRRVEILPARTHDELLPLIDETHAGIRRIEDRTPNLELPSDRLRLMADVSRSRETPHTWVTTLDAGADGSASVHEVDGNWPGTDLVIKVNGVRIATRGGNWGMDDSRKRVSVDHLEPYFRLHRDAHVNMIRDWMGQNTEESFYELADKYGLMVWNDFWESTQNYNLEAQDPELFLENARDSILHFRHHPSIVVWCGRNEGVPQPIINEGLAKLVRTLDHTRYYTGSSNQVNLRNSGPYQLQPLADYYKINRGFSVELGIPSVPTLESLKSFIPGEDLWPISDTWAYHDWHMQGNGAVKPFMDYMGRAFGDPTDIDDFARKAEMIDYAAHRAIFEGFAAHLWEPNSARLIWMTQPAWPSTEWNFLSHDYDTQSSFYGTQKACEPVHAQLNLEDGSVDLINLNEAHTFKVRARVVGLDNKTLFDRSFDVQSASNARTSVSKLDLAGLSGGNAILVQLVVSDATNRLVSDNLYWWSADEATLQQLNSLPQARLAASATLSNAGGERKLTVSMRNVGTVPALLLKLTLKDAVTGDRILPAYYSENYVSLLPGEDRTVAVDFPQVGQKPVVELRGWNLASQTAEPR